MGTRGAQTRKGYVMDVTFYKCNHCGNVAVKPFDKKVPLSCCGEKMSELIPGTSDGAHEKHVPVVEAEGKKITVKVGEVEHPMLEAHWIQWIALETKKGSQIKYLNPGEKPEAQFILSEDDEAVAAYEYCNLHGLWVAEV